MKTIIGNSAVIIVIFILQDSLTTAFYKFYLMLFLPNPERSGDGKSTELGFHFLYPYHLHYFPPPKLAGLSEQAPFALHLSVRPAIQTSPQATKQSQAQGTSCPASRDLNRDRLLLITKEGGKFMDY